MSEDVKVEQTTQAVCEQAIDEKPQDGDDASASEERQGGIDNFGDVATLASDATSKAAESAKNVAGQAAETAKNAAGQAAETAKNAAGQAAETAKNAASQVSQTAKNAYSRTTEAAKRAARTAGSQAAVKAEQNQERAAAAEDDLETSKTAREIVSQAWVDYFVSHKATVLYGVLGLFVGLCILRFGFWPVLLVVVTSYVGITYGRYRDGDAKVVDFLIDHFGDED